MLTGRGTGHGPGHTGTATSCWPLRGWASDPTARGPRGSSTLQLPRALHLRPPPPVPRRERPCSGPSTPDAKATVPAESCKTLPIRRSCSGFWLYVRGRRCGIRNGVFQNNFPCLAEKRFFLPRALLCRHLQGDPAFLRPTTLPFQGRKCVFCCPGWGFQAEGALGPLEALVKES